MSQFSRRNFLWAAGLAFPAASRLAMASNLETIGVQLYTVRDILPKKPLETLKAIKDMGYGEVEVIDGTIDAIWPAIQQTGLKAVSLHVSPDKFLPGKEAELDAALAQAHARGFQYVVYPWVDPQRRGGTEVFKALADTLNRAGAKCKKLDLQLCYHNHAFEFQPFGYETPMEWLTRDTDADAVGLELDVFWARVAGQSIPRFFEQYGSRVKLMHLKDLAKGTPLHYDEKVPPATFLEVGSGSIDFPEALHLGMGAGVKHFFVEQDHTPGDPLVSLKKSYTYLHDLKF